VYRWVKRYHQEGIEGLLELKTPPGKQSLVPPQVMNQLQQDLSQPQGFNSYSQIQE
jgi:transposase